MNVEFGDRVQVYMEGRVISRMSSSVFVGAVNDLFTSIICRPSTLAALIVQSIHSFYTNKTVYLRPGTDWRGVHREAGDLEDVEQRLLGGGR